jgi:DNA-binding protein HU-beta
MIIFVLRHADRRPDPDDALSDKGIDRAKLLARMLGESGIQIAWCSDALRAQATLQPLKQALGGKLAVHVVPTRGDNGVAKHQQHIIAAVKQLPADAVAAVVSHSNTVGPIIKGLTGQAIGEIGEEQFDKLFVLSIPAAGAATVTLLHYGAETYRETLAALDIDSLAAKRRQAIVTPIGAPPKPGRKGERIRIDGLGILQLRKRAARMGRNPATGEAFQIKASKKVAFRAAKGGGHRGAKKMMRPPPKPVPHIQRRPPAKKTPLVPAPAAAADVVDVSVFGPKSLRAGGECLVQVFLHTLAQQVTVAAQARETDAASERRGVKTLATEIARGTHVQIIFEGRGLSVDQAMQELTWRGEPDACQFTVGAPADAAGKTFYPRVLVLLNSVPVGTVTFALPATAKDAPAQTSVIRGDEARRYSYAFLSYSSQDRAEVLKRAQGLKAGGVDFFQDFVKLEPGDKWVPELDREIERCDLFLLFWSSHAKASRWVTKELNHALARRKSSGDGLPDIRPVMIGKPPPPSPPHSLKDIHFNDVLSYVLAAVEAERPKPDERMRRRR